MSPEQRLRALRDADRWTGDAAGPAQSRPGADRLRAGVVTVAVLAVIIAVVLGIPRLPHAVAPASPTATPSATPTVETDGSIPWDPSLVHSYRLYTKAEAAAVPGCSAEHLTTWAQRSGGGALGTFYQGVFVRNTGPLCSIARAGIRLDVGGVATARLLTGIDNGSTLLPTGATERLQAFHVEGCSKDSVHFPTTTEGVLRLTIGGTTRTLAATMPIAPHCDLRFDTWSMTQPASKDEREPGFTTDLRVSIPEIPDAYRGTAFEYTVRLTNTTAHAVELKPGTVYRQLVSNGAIWSVTTATLPVGSGRTLTPGASLGFRMHVPAPGDPGPGYWIGWYLADGTGGVASQI